MPFFPRSTFERRVLPAQELNVLHSVNKVDVLSRSRGAQDCPDFCAKPPPGAGLPALPPSASGGDQVLIQVSPALQKGLWETSRALLLSVIENFQKNRFSCFYIVHYLYNSDQVDQS